MYFCSYLPSLHLVSLWTLPQFTSNDITFSIPLMPWGQSSIQTRCLLSSPPPVYLPLKNTVYGSDWHSFSSKVKAVINSLCLLAYEPGNHEFTKYKCSEHLWCCHSLNKCLTSRIERMLSHLLQMTLVCHAHSSIPLWETMFLRTRRNETLPSDCIMLLMLSVRHITTRLQLLLGERVC